MADFPAGLDAAGQHLSTILADLGIDQPIELVVHREQELAVLLQVEREIGELQRILLSIEEFDIVVGQELFEARRAVVLARREVAGEGIASVIDRAQGAAPGQVGDDARLAAMDLQYHDLRPEKALFGRLSVERIAGDDEVFAAMSEPPTDTRAYFRGKCLQRWAGEIVAANWDSLVFDVGREPLRRVPMMEPLRGTATHVASLIDTSDTAAELLARLQQ